MVVTQAAEGEGKPAGQADTVVRDTNRVQRNGANGPQSGLDNRRRRGTGSRGGWNHSSRPVVEQYAVNARPSMGGNRVRPRQPQGGCVDMSEDAAKEVRKTQKEKMVAHRKDRSNLTEDVTLTMGMRFEDFRLKREILLALYEHGYEYPSPVQESAIPVAIEGKNIIARAKNGTGKTAAYLIPLLNRIDPTKECVQGLILVPTRELALQVSGNIMELGGGLKIRSMVSTGGTGLRQDILRFSSKAPIVVGTASRILDLTNKGVCRLDQCYCFILDEADKLLSHEMKPVIEMLIASFLPRNVQKLLFSATFPALVDDFKNTHMPDAIQLNLMPQLVLEGVTQYYAFVEEREKLHCLNTLLTRLNITQCIIFCNSVQRVELLAERITKLGFSCFYSHARMEHHDRSQVFHNFRMNASRVLVCTDLFARGLDIQTVNVVVNFDFPRNAETYLHRIGRSGRFGHRGLAINLITSHDVPILNRIELELNKEIMALPKQVDEALYV